MTNKTQVLEFLRDQIDNDDNDMNERQFDIITKRLKSNSGVDDVVVPLRAAQAIQQILPEKVSNKPVWAAIIVALLIALDTRFAISGQILELLSGL